MDIKLGANSSKGWCYLLLVCLLMGDIVDLSAGFSISGSKILQVRYSSLSPSLPRRLKQETFSIAVPSVRSRTKLFNEASEESSSDSASAPQGEDEGEDSTNGSGEASYNDSFAVSEKKVAGRKNRVVAGYKITSLFYVLYCLRSFLDFQTKTVTPLSCVVASGYGLAAGIAWILAGAAKSDRLASDTYKRLNLALLQYGSLGLMGWALVRLFVTSSPGWTVPILPSLFAVINAIKGFTYGTIGWDKQGGQSLVVEAGSSLMTMTKGLFAFQNPTAAAYLFTTWMVVTLKIAKAYEIFQLLPTARDTPALIVTRLSRFARYGLLSTVLYTLKDAADRNRLDGTTFIQLNGLISLTLTALSVYYAKATLGAHCLPVSIIGGIGATISAWNGLSSQRKRKQKQS